MIKINLASRKQSVTSSGSGMGGLLGGQVGGFLKNLKAQSARSDIVQALPWKDLVIIIAIGVIASVASSYYQNLKLQEVLSEKESKQQKKIELTKKVATEKQFDEKKKALDFDEKLIRTKLVVIHKLIDARNVLAKELIVIAGAIPKEVWLTDFKIVKEDINIKGRSLGYNQVSDFMTNLQQSVVFKDVRLQGIKKDAGKESNKENNEAPASSASFELLMKPNEVGAKPR